MVYVDKKGNVQKGTRPRPPGLQWQTKAILFAALAVVCYWFRPNPLANGRIPAADVKPREHWKRISTNDGFVREMTQNLSPPKKRNYRLENEMNMKSDHVEIMLGLVDFGGPDGHVFEGGDWSDMDSIRGTRCSSTQSALTAYFCGSQVATNQDLALEHERKPPNIGVQSFADYVTCRHKQGEQSGNHRRSVYRLGIGSEDRLAGYSHAFSIIAQPDGTFFWLQSFISQYSLVTWMEQTSMDGSPRGHLSLDELLAKLKQVQRLMNISAWTTEANNDYYELFGVDKEKEAIGKMSVAMSWKETHRLSVFYWDEACEYPVPDDDSDLGGDAEADKTGSGNNDKPGAHYLDQCDFMLGSFMLEELKKLTADPTLLQLLDDLPKTPSIE